MSDGRRRVGCAFVCLMGPLSSPMSLVPPLSPKFWRGNHHRFRLRLARMRSAGKLKVKQGPAQARSPRPARLLAYMFQ